MPFIQITNQEIYYAARGTHDAPLVFIHGAGGSHLEWNGQLAPLASRRADESAAERAPSVPADTKPHAAGIFALDLPGHGRSKGAGFTTVTDYAIVVREFLDALNIEGAIIVGISMGGAIAQTLSLEFPERVAGLVLVGTGARLRVAPQFLDGLKTDFENTARILVGNFYTRDAPDLIKEKSRDQLRKTGSVVTYNDFSACDAFDVRTRISGIAAPTLIVCGRDDKMTPVKYSEFLAQHIAGAELHVIENAGHMAMLEQPVEFNRILGEWVDDHFAQDESY